MLDMLDYSVFFSLITLVCSAGILTNENVNTLLGEHASLSCELPGAVGVKQVMWQRQHRAEEPLRTMVTFTEGSSPQVDDQFMEKVNVTVASMDTTTIVIKNVTFADEACYVCTFSVYPSGTERERTCLTVQGLTEITLLQTKPKEEEDAVVSCSATGKPTPVISWWIGEEKLSYESESETVKNRDGTITARSNLTLPQSQLSGQAIKCVARSGSVEKSEVIIVENQTDRERLGTSRHYVFPAVFIIVFVTVASFAVMLFHRRRQRCQKHLVELA